MRIFCASFLGLLGRAACEGEHFGDVGDVLVAHLYVLVAGAQVVVLLRQAETTLLDEGDLLGGVLEVLLLAVSEEGVDAVALQIADERGELGAASGSARASIRSSRGWSGLRPAALDDGGVHAGLEVVADLLFVGGAGGAAGLGLLQDAV